MDRLGEQVGMGEIQALEEDFLPQLPIPTSLKS